MASPGVRGLSGAEAMSWYRLAWWSSWLWNAGVALACCRLAISGGGWF